MSLYIYLTIDGIESLWGENKDSAIVIKENSMVSLRLVSSGFFDEKPLVYLEDYSIDVRQKDTGEFFSEESNLFREAFGHSVIRIYLKDLVYEIYFNVLMKKVNSAQVEHMINYLRKINDKILNICFSRTSVITGVHKDFSADPETLLCSAEHLIDQITNLRQELHFNLRKRLAPMKAPAGLYGENFIDFDPIDILDNLDKLEHNSGIGEVLINGRIFGVNGVEVTSLHESADVEENRILLGGVYSVKRKVESLYLNLTEGFQYFKGYSHDSEYESINNFLVRVTTEGMKIRCKILLEKVESFIRYLHVDLKVKYCGELKPKMTPYAKSSRVYRVIFDKLYLWYEIGTPDFEGINYLVKLKSISKIYELFSLYNIIEYLYEHNWDFVTLEGYEAFDRTVPKNVFCKKNSLTLTLNYEPRIYPYGSNSQHLDLVDLYHTPGANEFSYWSPDFVIKISSEEDSYYMILDAKYSYISSIQKYALPRLFEKYFLGMGVFDQKNNSFNNSKILAIYALFPGNGYSVSYWKKDKIGSIYRYPMVNGVSLSTSTNTEFYKMLDQVINVIAKNFIR